MEEVYEPREDSFLLVHNLPDVKGKKVLDVGTGSGILAIEAAERGGRVVAVDVNPDAIKTARENALKNAVGIEFRVSDLFSNVPEKFEVLLFNPPYLPYEDRFDENAPIWCGGKTGREVLERFAKEAPAHLNPNGTVAIVFSSITGIEEVQKIFERAGFSARIVADEKIEFEKLVVLHANLR